MNWEAMGVTYMAIPLFLIMFLYYKIKYKTKLIPLDEVDLSKPDITKE